MSVKNNNFYGIKVGEEFEIVELPNNPHTLTENGIVNVKGYLCPLAPDGIAFNQLHIKYSGFKPELDDIFFSFDLLAENILIKAQWQDTDIDSILFERHLVFKTQEEAERKLEEISKCLEK